MAGTAAALAAGLLLGACAGLSTPLLNPGDSADTVRQRLGTPTAEHPAAGGGMRLEFGTGAFGKRTTMVDVDAQGRVLRAENVLTEERFNAIKAGITKEQLRQLLGQPSRVWAVRFHDQTVWSYRYEGPFCQMFHVGILPSGVVEDTSYGMDPACERDERFMGRPRGIGW